MLEKKKNLEKHNRIVYIFHKRVKGKVPDTGYRGQCFGSGSGLDPDKGSSGSGFRGLLDPDSESGSRT